MPSLFLALIASALAMLGTRQARLVAHLSGLLGGNAGLLTVCWMTSIVTTTAVAWGGSALAPLMPPAGKTMFVAAALAAAGLELAWPMRKAPPREPTQSLGAIALVLLTGQLTDAARFLVLALGVATAHWQLASVGGVLGSGAVLTMAWSLGSEWETRLPLRAVRLALAAAFVIAAVVVGMTARGIMG
ncbi:hypothetical protein GRI89_11390 [Altererythrobacter salegens]|uniref:GDT1 family protein n=1 Tax=Croceibacterium salegens TaxID=1737568 RepID=A0A6I4T0I7_9SPHN|nr:hypothetical protein [Croceibacterium salegens]MXO60142.1 hypothetical protein [Croceibacterium salegens]